MIDSTSSPPNDTSEPLTRFAAPRLALALFALACATSGETDLPSRGATEERAAAPTASANAGASANGTASASEAPNSAAPDSTETAPGSTGTAPGPTETAPDGAEGPTTTAGDAGSTAPDERGDGGGANGDETAENGSDAESKSGKEGDEEDAPERIVLDTVYDDADVGEDQTTRVERELGLVQDEALTRYVRSVALRLLRHAPSRPFDYTFEIVDQPVPNAFALPGGKIYVSRGLLALATSEDELAAVIGHEITHAAERHAAARLEYSRRLNPFAIGLMRAAQIAAYGRDQELDADRGGQILSARAGYDPRAIATFLRKLDAAERYEIGWARIPSFLATHPTSPQRSAVANDRAASLAWTRSPGVSGDRPEDYYTRIDGLVLGEDPAGGVFDEENRFLHPELRFGLRFPNGWDTMNGAQAVRAVSPRRDAQAELSLAGGGERSLDEIVDEFLEEDFGGLRIRIDERLPMRLGELPAIRIDGRARGPGGSLDLTMTFVRHGELVYRLSMLSLPNGTSRYRAWARAFAHSFRPLDEETVHSLEVTRLRIARAREGETLQDLSVRTRNALELVYTGVLNGLYPSTPLAARTPVKIGIREPYLPRSKPEDDAKDGPADAPTGNGS